jgi:hypothetical protein
LCIIIDLPASLVAKLDEIRVGARKARKVGPLGEMIKSEIGRKGLKPVETIKVTSRSGEISFVPAKTLIPSTIPAAFDVDSPMNVPKMEEEIIPPLVVPALCTEVKKRLYPSDHFGLFATFTLT